MATHTMHVSMMIFLSPRVHEQNKQSRDAITTDAHGEQFWRRSITFGDYCGLSESTRGSGKALGTIPHHTAWNGHKHRTVRIWLGRRRCDDFYGIGGGRRTVSRPGRLDDAEKSSHLVLLLDHVEDFGGCQALVRPGSLQNRQDVGFRLSKFCITSAW